MPDQRVPIAAKPSRTIFDPYNSSATGHQRAENSISSSTSWRESRTRKLREQFQAGKGGGKRMWDTVGSGSLGFGKDGRTANGGWARGAAGLRTDGQQSILEAGFKLHKDLGEATEEKLSKRLKPSKVVNPFTPFIREDGKVRETSWTCRGEQLDDQQAISTNIASKTPSDSVQLRPEPPSRRIFDNLTIYLNGTTAPTISDHKLKQILSENGARLSIALVRRSVTHVILGKPNRSGGVGGGLASSKIQKEIARVGGKGVKYVSVDWVIESIKAGKRLPESRFEALRLAPHGMGSVATLFRDGGPKATPRDLG